MHTRLSNMVFYQLHTFDFCNLIRIPISSN